MFMTATYKATALQLMLGEANFASQQLQLPTPHPIEITNVVWGHVSPPTLRFGGAINTTNFNFCINDKGKLWQIVKLEDGHEYLSTDKVIELRAQRPKSQIDNDGAYQFSKKWLLAMDVDVAGIEAKYKHQVEQLKVSDPPGSTNLITLPVFFVKWGDVAKVTILGSTKELMELVVNDSLYLRRPAIVVPKELNNVEGPKPKQMD